MYDIPNGFARFFLFSKAARSLNQAQQAQRNTESRSAVPNKTEKQRHNHRCNTDVDGSCLRHKPSAVAQAQFARNKLRLFTEIEKNTIYDSNQCQFLSKIDFILL